MRTLKVTLAALLMVVAAGCSDDGSGTSTEVSDEAKPYAEALATGLAADDASDLILDQRQADCVGATWVNVITPERLEENGLDPEKLEDPDALDDFNTLGISESEAGTMVDGFDTCGVDLRQLVLDGLTDDEGESATEEQQACFEDAVTDDAVKQLFVTGLTATDQSDVADETDNGLLGALMSCAPVLGGPGPGG